MMSCRVIVIVIAIVVLAVIAVVVLVVVAVVVLVDVATMQEPSAKLEMSPIGA